METREHCPDLGVAKAPEGAETPHGEGVMSLISLKLKAPHKRHSEVARQAPEREKQWRC